MSPKRAMSPKRSAEGKRAGRLPAPADAKSRRRAAADSYPALSAVLAGYLHQDFVLDYATPTDAIAAFMKDASAAEQSALRQEWARFARATAQLNWSDAQRAFGRLGGAWRPPSRRALEAAFAALEAAKLRSGRS